MLVHMLPKIMMGRTTALCLLYLGRPMSRVTSAPQEFKCCKLGPQIHAKGIWRRGYWEVVGIR